jgi:hypothetical protein
MDCHNGGSGLVDDLNRISDKFYCTDLEIEQCVMGDVKEFSACV